MPANERCDDPLLNTLEDPATIELLLSVIFDKKVGGPENGDGGEGAAEDAVSEGGGGCYCESSLVNGISILMALLESRRQQSAAASMASAVAGVSAATFNAATSGQGMDSSGMEGVSPEEVEKQQKILDATIKAILPR